MSPSNAMWPGPRPTSDQVESSSIQPLGHNRHGPKTGGARPTSIPSGILVHQPFGHNRHGPKIEGLCPFREEEVGPHLTQCGMG